MSDTDTQPEVKPRSGYAVTFTPFASGHVQVHHWPYAVEGMPGWYSNPDDAKRAAAEQMRHLANELLRASYELTIDRNRGR